MHAALSRRLLREFVARIRMTRYAQSWIVVEYAGKTPRRIVRSIGHGNLPGMERESHAHAAPRDGS